ncbi:MAG: KEOPS complex kinase/ATPase Bud32 [Candidatus Micrarchaeota archaeon]
MRGAEAVLEAKTLLGRRCVVKNRVRKGYRAEELDSRLRAARTRGEARLLHKAKLAGVPCPTVLEAEEFALTMTFMEGRHPKMEGGEAREAGRLLALLHRADIIHGDYTPANLFVSGGRIAVIDFGLGFVSNDIEDKAVDAFTMLRLLDSLGKEAFIAGYSAYEKSKKVLARVKEVEKRVRYAF